MRAAWTHACMLATLTALCWLAHARALPLFTTHFVVPADNVSQPELAERVYAYIADLAQRKALTLASNWTAQVVLQSTAP